MPRTLDYHLLRVCERLGLREDEFRLKSYGEQLRLIAYDQIRGYEEAATQAK